MDQKDPGSNNFPRLLVYGLVIVIVLAGLILILNLTLYHPIASSQIEQTNALANSKDSCVECHQKTSRGILEQYGKSSMAAAKVTCRDCHQVNKDYPGSVLHEGTYVLQVPTTAMCQKCHPTEVAQYNQSRHSIPAWVAVSGSKGMSQAMLAAYQSIPEGTFAPDSSRNAIAALEGGDVTKFACETCHSIGKPAADNSIGRCQTCHIRHEFSLEQVRKPETCNACHIGPDHPQWEIYQESMHGVAYQTSGTSWNWDADPGTLTVKDFPAPTCSTCHISGFGGTTTTHDVGERLTWYLFAPISQRRPAWEANKTRMQSVCLECHNQNFVDTLYTNADKATESINASITESNTIMQPLKDQKILTDAPFDQPIDFTYFEVWHHWGRTAKFGTWMQGADYVQWHGAYEILKGLAELRQYAADQTSTNGVK
jgi:hydroxylamine dehydrogenase